jgi:hypothetical protein
MRLKDLQESGFSQMAYVSLSTVFIATAAEVTVLAGSLWRCFGSFFPLEYLTRNVRQFFNANALTEDERPEPDRSKSQSGRRDFLSDSGSKAPGGNH